MPDAHSGYGLPIGGVLRSQGKLVDTIGLFTPKIVRMDG
ncbi:MAG TPA: hypothetical protein VGN00_07815 [Puia sp.]